MLAPLASRIGGGRIAALPIAVRFWDGSELALSGQAPVATVLIRGPEVVARLIREPTTLGLARAWITGGLDVEGELDTLLGLRARLAGVRLSAREHAWLALVALRLAGRAAIARPPLPAHEVRPRGRRHSRTRDRAAISHHYDISNRFYELLLGPSMSYSCASFGSPDDSLEAAQERKHELICEQLQLASGERLLDIGCGWGSLLLHAVRHHGVRGVGVTLSVQQAELARRRVREAGLSDQIEIRIADYRELRDGPYDKIASIGMYEHVGAARYGLYLRQAHALLAPGGRFLNDGIARLYSSQAGRDTFITRYVFPDGELHPIAAFLTEMQNAGLEIRGVRSLREDYARTLRCWYANLERDRAQARAEVGEERVRVWETYILGSAHAFIDGEITNYHVVAERS